MMSAIAPGAGTRSRRTGNSTTVALTHEPSGTRYTLEVRAFDDGVAFRYVVPEAGGAGRVPDEATGFSVPPGSTVWYHDLDGHYEGTYDRKEIEDVAEGDWAAPPLTVRLPDGAGYASITEAALSDYAGMALQADRRGVFQARLGHAVPASYPYRLRYPALEVLRLAMPAVLGENLARLLPSEQVQVFPWGRAFTPDAQVLVEITQLEGTLGANSILTARWRILGRAGTEVRAGTSRLSEPTGKDYESLVAAHSRLLGALSRDIAEALRSTEGLRAAK